MSKLDPREIEVTGRWMSEARNLLAYGGLDGVVHRPLFDGADGVFPHFATSAAGCRLVDSTGQSYIDWVNGWGPVLLGYRHEKVEQAIINQLQAGPTLSLMSPIELDVAKLINELVPCAEMVAFGKNGSDSVTAALRIARAVTGRDVVLQFGFHGFHDWYACLHPQVTGITPVLREYVDSFEYNDLQGLGDLLQKYSGRVAAVIMEPVNMWMPNEGYLAGVRELTQRHGALLIFDEMVTAFRVARGGAQELFGVEPDLACLGKGMANGMPLSAVVGRRNYMQYLPGCGFGMTFRGETLSLAAAKATLEVIRDEPVTEHLNEMGQMIRDGFHELCQELGVNCCLSGPNSRMTFVFNDQSGVNWSDARSLFLQECLKRGVLTNGNLLPSYAHDKEAVDETLACFRNALEVLVRAFEQNEDVKAIPMGGSMFEIKALQATGFVDHVREEGDELEIGGWILLNSGVIDSIEFRSHGGVAVQAEKKNRPDLVEAFPNQIEAEWAGFQAILSAKDFLEEGLFKFTIVGLNSDKTCYQCLVNYQKGRPFSGPWSLSDGVLYV